MRLRHNLLAAGINSVWTAAIGLAVVPLYLKYLGIEAYGLIGFFTTIQALFQLLDLGLAPTINREVARASASGNLRETGKLLHTLAVIYWGMAGLIALIVITAATFIAQYWIHSKTIPQETIAHAVMLMGVVVACRWPIGLYQGALMGAQRLTVSSGINMLMVTFGNLGAVGILAFVSPTIEAFFLWQTLIGLIYALVMRRAAWSVLGGTTHALFSAQELKRIWRFSAGIGGITITTLILTQIDKVLLSKILSLENFAHYTLAGVVAGGLAVLIAPVFNAIYPRFSALVSQDEIGELTNLYRLGTRLLGAVLFPIAFMVALFSQDLIWLWTGNEGLASNVAPIVSLLLIGTAINGIMHFPYSLQLAYGMVRLPLMIAIGLVIVLVPTIIFLALKYGAVGGAAAWLLLNAIYLVSGTLLTHRYLLKGLGLRWLLSDVGIPLGISLLVMTVGEEILQMLAYRHDQHFARLLLGGALLCIAIMLSFAFSPGLRNNLAAWYQRTRPTIRSTYD